MAEFEIVLLDLENPGYGDVAFAHEKSVIWRAFHPGKSLRMAELPNLNSPLILTKESCDLTINGISQLFIAQCTHFILVPSVFQLWEISRDKEGAWGNIIGVFECRVHIEKPVSMMLSSFLYPAVEKGIYLQGYRPCWYASTQEHDMHRYSAVQSHCIFFGDKTSKSQIFGISSSRASQGPTTALWGWTRTCTHGQRMGLVQLLQGYSKKMQNTSFYCFPWFFNLLWTEYWSDPLSVKWTMFIMLSGVLRAFLRMVTGHISHNIHEKSWKIT